MSADTLAPRRRQDCSRGLECPRNTGNLQSDYDCGAAVPSRLHFSADGHRG